MVYFPYEIYPCKNFDAKKVTIKRGSATAPPYAAGKKKFFFDFIVLNDRSSQTIVKSKISNHFVVPMKNGSKNKFKGSILTL